MKLKSKKVNEMIVVLVAGGCRVLLCWEDEVGIRELFILEQVVDFPRNT